MKSRLIIGLMSGTSVDAIDAALVRVTIKARGQYTAKVLHHTEQPWPRKLRQRLLAVMAPASCTSEEICQLNVLVAQQFAAAVEKSLQLSKVPRSKIAALGSHGQTICHLPPSRISNLKSQIASTLQLGDPSVLATLTGIRTVGNFRPADMALGGQGAPLVPWTDAVLLSHITKSRAIQNIGGIANVTYLSSGQWSVASGQNVIAFDTGPGNMLLDAVMSLATQGKDRYDKNGRLAAKGSLDLPLFRQLQSHPYFSQRPPKSTGREAFGQQLARQILTAWKRRHKRFTIHHSSFAVLLHTLTRLTAWSIADAYLHFLPALPDEVILCGGGADNPTLVRMVTEELGSLHAGYTQSRPPKIRRIDEFGIPNKAKEAASFALLAAATLDGIPANLPLVTGASRPTILGVIVPQ